MSDPEPLAPIEFWFDFASPYAYFAALEIDDLAARHGRTVVWRPFLLSAVFKLTGARPLTQMPMKGEYARRDWRRIAESKGISFVLPSVLSNAVPAVRAYYHLEQQSPTQAASFAKAAFQGHFNGWFDCSDVEHIVALTVRLGHGEGAIRSGIADPNIKARAIAASREAIERGVFGVPWIFVDEEPFWGWDRLPMVERRVATQTALSGVAPPTS